MLISLCKVALLSCDVFELDYGNLMLQVCVCFTSFGSTKMGFVCLFRGKGSRALLKKLKQGVLVHDASYYSAVQLEGPEVVYNYCRLSL